MLVHTMTLAASDDEVAKRQAGRKATSDVLARCHLSVLIPIHTRDFFEA